MTKEQLELRQQALKELTIGSVWVYKNEPRRPLKITKITKDTIFFEREYANYSHDNASYRLVERMITELISGQLLKYQIESIKMRIVFNDKNNNTLLQKEYDGQVMVYQTNNCLVVCRNELFVEKIYFSDIPNYDNHTIYNYD